MNAKSFDHFTRRLSSRMSRRNLLAATGLLTAGAALVPQSVLGQTPPADSAGGLVLSLRSYIMLGTKEEVADALPSLIMEMEAQPGFLDYRVAELGDSTLATISSFLDQASSDAASEVEAAYIAESLGSILTEPVDSISGQLLAWSISGAGVVCHTMFQDPCPSQNLTCCPTTARTDGSGICVNAQTTCPGVLPAASPAAACKAEGCDCATGTEFPCDEGLSCCPESEETPPGGAGICRETCGG